MRNGLPAQRTEGQPVVRRAVLAQTEMAARQQHHALLSAAESGHKQLDYEGKQVNLWLLLLLADDAEALLLLQADLLSDQKSLGNIVI